MINCLNKACNNSNPINFNYGELLPEHGEKTWDSVLTENKSPEGQKLTQVAWCKVCKAAVYLTYRIQFAKLESIPNVE